MHALTAFQRDLLYVVAGLSDDPNGVDIKDELEEYYRKEINYGRLYPALDVLVEKGLVDKREVDGRTNSYQLTDRGRQEIADHLVWKSKHIDIRGG